MAIGRKAFKVWLSCTILWWIAIGVLINAGGFFPAHYQANFPLRPDLPPFDRQADSRPGPLQRPLYDIVRSPSAEKLRVQFEWLGYQGPLWNQHVNSRDMQSFAFASGETLDLPSGLTGTDRDYIKKAFWDQRWTRWRDIFRPYLAAAIFPPLAILAAIWGLRRLRVLYTGKEPAPEPPRLPYSPAMQRLRRITLYVSVAELLLCLAFAVVNDVKDPQPPASLFWFLMPMYLPPLAALTMSLLWRGPIAAALLAGLGLYLLLPLLAASLLPASWQ